MLKPEEYVGLHTHSTYSSLDGYGRMDQIVPRIKDLGQFACGLTDHGSVFGHLDFYTAMRAADLIPILGVEFYHCRSVKKDKGKETADKKKSAAESMSIPHLTVLARNLKGYRNLLKLYDLSWREGFYRKPRIDWDMLLRHSEGLTVLSGCYMSILSRMVRDGQAEEAHKYISFLRDHMNFYVEIVPVPDFADSLPVIQTLWKIAQDLKVPVVISDDAHFPDPDHHRVQDAMLCINMGKTLDDPLRKIKLPEYLYRCSAQDIFARALAALPDVPADEIATACRRSVEIARQCQVEIPHTTGPVFQIQTKDSPEGLLRRWIQEGKEWRQGMSLVPEETDERVGVYDARIAYELSVIESKEFVNYFLIVADIVRWMREQKILAIARGSCGGSLICFYLGITQIDPIQWGLPFERFLNPERRDMPDIDIDIDTRHRDRVVEWVIEKYGRDRCAQIATLNEFGAKQALLDICKVCRIPDTIRDELKRLLPEGMEEGAGLKARGILKRLFEKNPRAQDLLKKYPDLRLAAELEGQLRQVSVHAAGVVIDKDPLIETVGIATHPKRIPLIACDKEHAASIGLLKIDLLGVDMLAVMAECMHDLKKESYDVCRIPLDRHAVYEMLGQGRSMGVFQMQGGTTARVLQQLKPTDFNDLIALMALARPGPLDSGGTNDYILRKHGRMEMPHYHELITNCLRDTYGVIIYQEQVMSIMRDVGGMTWKQVHDVRKIIAKSGGAKKMEPYRGPYLEAAARQGVPVREAERVWTMCQEAGGYLFNKCITGDTVIERPKSKHGGEITVEELFHAQNSSTPWGKKIRAGKVCLLQMDADGRVRPGRMRAIYSQGIRDVFCVKTAGGRSIRITHNHQLLTERGYSPADELNIGDRLVVMEAREGYCKNGPKSTATGNHYHGQGFGFEDNNPSWIDGRTALLKRTRTAIQQRANGCCERCGKTEEGRFEAAHQKTLEQCGGCYIEYHAPSNLKWLCNSCHKNFDYAKGERKPRWSKGQPTGFDTIVSIEPDGSACVYDIEMDTPEHNFIANGIVSHNSHGAIYAQDAYWSAFLLVNFPAIYTFRFARYANDEKKRGIFRQFQLSGGRFQLLDYKRSDVDFTVVDGNTILGGWSNIVGVGPVIAKQMVEKRHTFDSWSYALNQLPPNVADLLSRSGVESGQLDPDIALYLAPWYVQIDYLPVEKDVFKRLHCHTIASVYNWMDISQRNSFCLVGRVVNAEVRGKKGALQMTVADETGVLDVWFSEKKWQEVMGNRNPMRGDTDGIGNSVLLMGSTTGDGHRCFGDDCHWVRTCTNVKPDAAMRAKRRNMSDDERAELRGLQQQLEMEE